MYRISVIDGHDEDIADTLSDLHRLTFFDGALVAGFSRGDTGRLAADAMGLTELAVLAQIDQVRVDQAVRLFRIRGAALPTCGA